MLVVITRPRTQLGDSCAGDAAGHELVVHRVAREVGGSASYQMLTRTNYTG